MLLLSAEAITYKYNSQVESIIENVSLKVYEESRIGLIGRNGCGKSTLCRILNSDLKTDQGNIWRQEGLITGYIEQESSENSHILCGTYILEIEPGLGRLWEKVYCNNQDNPEPEAVIQYVENNGYVMENRLYNLLGQFGLLDEVLRRDYTSLSGGEKTRVRLLRCLLKGFDIMLLDEPTNHLDMESLDWLENYLNQSHIPYIIISHDRYFLDQCVTTIWELKDRKLNEYSGNYSSYKSQKEAELEYQKKQYNIARSKIRQLTQAAHDKRNWAQSFQAQTGSEGRASVYESVTNDGKRAMHRAKVTEHRLEKMREKAEAEKPFIEKKREISFSKPRRSGTFAVSLNNISKSFGNQVILHDFSLSVERQEKVAIIGANGSGKSTLLRIIAGKLSADSGKVRLVPSLQYGYFSQEFEELDPEKTIIEEVSSGNKELAEKARTIMGCLHIARDKVFQKIGSLSFGEKNKTVLAKLIVSEYDVLLLDEPTNHLELETREELEKALVEFPGAVILVSHDRYLVERIADRIIKLGI